VTPAQQLEAELVVVGTDFRLRESRTAETFGWEKARAKERTAENRSALEDLQYHLYADRSRSLLVVLQGIDAAGKDGLIRNVFTAFNPQGTTVTSFKVPAGREAEHDYLWRVHAACPPRGSIGVFNRSHYEDLIVPMVRGQATADLLDRRIGHILDFERMLTDEGTRVVKFLLHISRDEQWKRLTARLDEPTKNWKFSMADLAERERWDRYIEVFEQIVGSTSTAAAPWYVIPADAKWFRDLAVSEIVRAALESMELRWPSPSIDVEPARRALDAAR
jgi:PPK2 family polyphosphate:nucleotide phosphotransferase